MENTRIDLPGVKEIIVKADGDLKISGWDESGAFASCESDTLSVSIENEIAHIKCHSDLKLMVPCTLPIQIDESGGDLMVKDIKEKVQAAVISGDAKIANIHGKVLAENINGDARMQNISGEVRVESVSGDFAASNIEFPITIGNIGGDLSLKNCDQDTTAKAGGDISIIYSNNADRKVLLHAGGDMHLHFAAEPSGKFNTVAGSGTTEVQLLGEKQLKGSSVNQFDLGEGVGEYKLEARGDIHICNLEACQSRRHTDFGFANEIGFDHISIDFGKIPGIDTDAIQEKINAKLEKLHEKTEKINTRIEEKMQKHFIKLQRYSNNESSHLHEHGQKVAQTDPISEDEKKLILKMLQDKKISPEEAERLFESLEDN